MTISRIRPSPPTAPSEPLTRGEIERLKSRAVAALPEGENQQGTMALIRRAAVSSESAHHALTEAATQIGMRLLGMASLEDIEALARAGTQLCLSLPAPGTMTARSTEPAAASPARVAVESIVLQRPEDALLLPRGVLRTFQERSVHAASEAIPFNDDDVLGVARQVVKHAKPWSFRSQAELLARAYEVCRGDQSRFASGWLVASVE